MGKENLHQNIAIRLVKLALLHAHIDLFDKALVNDIVDAPLNRVEIAPVSDLVRLGKFQNGCTEHLVCVGPADHELRETHKQTLGVLRISRIAVVVLEDLEAASMRDVEKLEVWIEFCEAVEDRGATKGPLVLRHKGTARNRCPAGVVLDGLRLVQDDAVEHHPV